MFEGLLNMAGNLIPDETKADAVYASIDKILNYQSNKFKVPISILSANITKSNNVLEVDIWKLNNDGGYDHLGEVSRKELIKILSK